MDEILYISPERFEVQNVVKSLRFPLALLLLPLPIFYANLTIPWRQSLIGVYLKSWSISEGITYF